MKILLAGLFSLGIAVSALAALETGEPAPLFVYFYPSAYTQGCNIQAHEFSVRMEQFTAAGASVIGVSLDSIERLNDFSADPEYCAGNLAVASDEAGDIARSFGLDVRGPVEGAKDTRGVEIGHGFAERVTFIVRPDGRIAETIGGLSPTENVERSLEAVRRLPLS
jgi:peroxiredoxin Q/BCP